MFLGCGTTVVNADLRSVAICLTSIHSVTRHCVIKLLSKWHNDALNVLKFKYSENCDNIFLWLEMTPQHGQKPNKTSPHKLTHWHTCGPTAELSDDGQLTQKKDSEVVTQRHNTLLCALQTQRLRLGSRSCLGDHSWIYSRAIFSIWTHWKPTAVFSANQCLHCVRSTYTECPAEWQLKRPPPAHFSQHSGSRRCGWARRRL